MIAEADISDLACIGNSVQQQDARLVGGRGEQANVHVRPWKPPMGNIDESIARNERFAVRFPGHRFIV